MRSRYQPNVRRFHRWTDGVGGQDDCLLVNSVGKTGHLGKDVESVSRGCLKVQYLYFEHGQSSCVVVGR